MPTTKSNFDKARAALRFTDIPVTGNLFFVDSSTGSATGGHTVDTPAATITQALALCTANKGDVIYLFPGHAEIISAAAGIAITKAGVSIIGLGSGTLQPKITFDTIISADLDIDAANVTLENIHFTANFADITAPIDVNAQFCTIRKCRFSETATNMNAVIWILGGSTTTSSGLVVEDCVADDADAANTHFVSLPGTDRGNIIRRNYLYGDWGTAAIGAAGNVVNIQVHGNTIYNAATDNDSCVNIATAGTGFVSFNICTSGAAQANGITAPGCGKFSNAQGVNGEDLTALQDPINT
jgi:hypothetical protein